MVKKILIWGGVAFLIFFIAFRPDSAANTVKALGGAVADIARGGWDFLGYLFS